MPRWIWIALASLFFLWCWREFRSPDLAQLKQAGSNTVDCPLPEKFQQPNSTLQSDIGNRIEEIKLDEATIIPQAGFSLQARVLSRENYSFDAGAEFSPVDLALGWGPMAEPDVTEKLNISQSGRWYHYSWDRDGPPIPLREMISHSANMHMVPASTEVAESLEEVSEGDVIELNGWLIQIKKPDGWKWQSSLSREDSGAGACELIYVCTIEVKNNL
jgi:hypothetical protein